MNLNRLRSRPWWPVLLLLAGLLSSAGPVLAADAPAATLTASGPAALPPAHAGVQTDEVPVKVLQRQIAVLRAPLFGVSAADRARRSERRIEELLARGGPGEVTIQREPQGNVLLVDGAMALALGPDDVDRLGGESLEALSFATQQALARAIDETRQSRDRNQLLQAAWRSGLATAGFILAVWVVLRLRRLLVARGTALLQSRAGVLEVAGAPLLQTAWLYSLMLWLIRGLVALALLSVAYEWLAYVLVQFAYTRPWGEALGGFLVGLAQRIGGGILGAVPDLIVAIVIFMLARMTVVALGPVFDRVERGQGRTRWLDKDTVAPTRTLVNVGVWLFAIVMAYPYLPGADSEAFKGMSVLVGLMITIGGSSLVGQGASGLILMYSRTLRVGEFVRIDEQEGTVTEIGTFTTKIRTGLGEEISFPNAVVLGTTTKNYSRAVKGHGFVVDTVVTIGYDTPWRQVREMLLEAASLTPGIAMEPRPRVFKTALSDFYVEYRLACYATPEEPLPRAEVLDALHANVLDVFNESGVQIMSPHYLGDPAGHKVVARDDPFAAPPRHTLVEGSA